jgi:clan AA aspartic protease
MIEYINNRFVWKPSTTKDMGQVHAEIDLMNGEDVIDARRYRIGLEEIRRIAVRALVDTGSQYLCINENIQEVLQLPRMESKPVELANGTIIRCDIVGPVDIKFDNRSTGGKAIVLPGNSEPLLGLLPLEDLDVIIDPKRMQLLINPDHPEGAVHRL